MVPVVGKVETEELELVHKTTSLLYDNIEK
jgi:hypothetical protein